MREYLLERGELLKAEALFAARLLQGAEIELLPTGSLFESATRISIEIDHPAYDCLYLVLAVELGKIAPPCMSGKQHIEG